MPHRVLIGENPPAEKGHTSQVVSSPSPETPPASLEETPVEQGLTKEKNIKKKDKVIAGKRVVGRLDELIKKEAKRNKKEEEPKIHQEWLAHYQELKDFFHSNGHCDVTQVYEQNPTLGHWIRNQRTLFKDGKLHDYRVAKLNEVNFSWSGRQERLEYLWNKHYQELKEYHHFYGHCNPSKRDKQYSTLDRWVRHQRETFKAKKLRDDRIAKLNKLEFVWEVTGLYRKSNKYDSMWDKSYQELKEYLHSNGHFNVPEGYGQNQALARWIKTQRQKFKAKKLRDDRIAKLNELGFEWTPSARKLSIKNGWDKRYQELKEYIRFNGHCNVPHDDKLHPSYSLGMWIARQRKIFKRGALSADRIARLKKVDFPFKAPIGGKKA